MTGKLYRVWHRNLELTVDELLMYDDKCGYTSNGKIVHFRYQDYVSFFELAEARRFQVDALKSVIKHFQGVIDSYDERLDAATQLGLSEGSL